jgi:hypothetical protein
MRFKIIRENTRRRWTFGKIPGTIIKKRFEKAAEGASE